MWLSEIQGELEREKQMRIYVFPRLKQSGKLTDAEAMVRLARLNEAIQLIVTLRDAGIHQTDQLPLRLTAPGQLNREETITSLPIIIKGGEQ